MQVFLGLSLKWLVRIFLVAFYAVMGYYQLHGQNPFGWLASDHPWLTMLLIAVTCYAFLPPIVTLRKETVGGEVTMRKATWLLVLIIAVLIMAVVYYAYKPFQSAVNSNVLAPISAGFGGVLTSIYASPIWKSYFAPTRWAYGWGLLSMAVLAVVAFKFVKPQVQKIRVPTIRSPTTFNPQREPSEPEYAPIQKSAPTKPIETVEEEVEVIAE